ncbi:MAG: GNAT family N-acetyltransferase [Anaerolineaceae bacterium]|nr:GNAT family N-acetyltransferase [Anaerolineaceae bacterium]
MKILETKRLILRHQVLTDLDDLYALYCDPDIIKYIPDAPRNYQETREELEWHMNGHPKHPELGLWATIHKGTNKFIGRCGLLPWTVDSTYEVEVAYTISKAFWGQGLGYEAAQAILNYGFDQLHLTRLICLIDPDNLASKKVATKIGMSFEKDWIEELGPLQVYSRNRY